MIKPTPAPMEPEHSHAFDTTNPLAERRTRQVMWLTAAMMVVEIVAGTLLGSMALLADGWHMSSHALALGVSAGAYALLGGTPTIRDSRSAPGKSRYWGLTPARSSCSVSPPTWGSNRSRVC